MKKHIVFILLFVLNMIWMSGCSKGSYTSTEPTITEPTVTETLVTEPPVPAINHVDLGVDDQYTISGGDTLLSYYEEPIESFDSVCKYYEEQGWYLYNSHSLNHNQFATYTKENELVHIYWIACERELNVVISSTGGHSLPPAEPSVKTGASNTTVTQLQSSEVNGMGYVVQLADGSFLIIDGGYASCAKGLWSTLVHLNNGEENIIIRAWLLTHSHSDHYGCFSQFASRYASKVTLETLMMSPLSDADAVGYPYLCSNVQKDIAKFEGAKTLYVHTGMAFDFCNITLEILYTGDEFMIAEPVQDKDYAKNMDFNSSSIISRIYTDDYRAIFLADCTEETALRLLLYYGECLKSEMCQVSHHGVENCPLIVYRFIDASTYWFPCSLELFEMDGRHADVRKAILVSKSTKEIIMHDQGPVIRPLHTNDGTVP